MVVTIFITLFAFSTPGFAALIKGDVAKGPIIAMDSAKGEITVSDYRSGRDITYKVSREVLASFQKGQVVIIRSDPGSNVAKSVRPVVRRR